MKWPKFLTFKRTLLIIILVVCISCLVGYFVGGYKPVQASHNAKAFNPDKLVSYETLYNKNKEVAQTQLNNATSKAQSLKNNNATAEEWNEAVEALAFIDEKDKFVSVFNSVVSSYQSKANLEKEAVTIALASIEDYTKENAIATKKNALDNLDATSETYESDKAKLEQELLELQTEATNNLETYASEIAALRLTASTKEASYQEKYQVYEEYKKVLDKTYKTYPALDQYIHELANNFVKVMENDEYSFYFNYRYSSFKIVFKDANGNETDTEWYSNPQTADEDIRNASVINQQNSQLNIWYANAAGTLLLYTNYEYCLTNKNRDNEEVMPSFSFSPNADNNSFIVYYTLARRGIDYTYFPQKISEERLNYFINENHTKYEETDALYWSERDINRFKLYYERREGEVDTDGNVIDTYYVCDLYEGMTATVRKNLYNWLYEKCGYTQEDAALDNAYFGVTTEVNKAGFKIAIEYSLGEEGFEATILSNSIEELVDGFLIARVDLLPYFTSIKSNVVENEKRYETSGYMLIPDGSGGIIELNNGKTEYYQYSKAVYSTDLAFKNEIKVTETEDILLPMYAIVEDEIRREDNSILQKGTGLLVRGIQGETQLILNANISGIADSYNRIYYTVGYRETQVVTIGTGYYATPIDKWTQKRVENDITISYSTITEGNSDYSSIAKQYREILQNEYNITPTDDTDSVVLNVEYIGVYDNDANILGINYTEYKSLSNFRQMVEMTSNLVINGANNINIYLQGWRKKGLIDESFQSIKYSKLLGSKKDYNYLLDYIEALNNQQDKDIVMYPYVNFGEYNNYQETFGKNRYTVRDVSNEYVTKYPYNLATNVYDVKKSEIYTLSPKYYNQFMTNFTEAYNKKIGLDSVLFDVLGSKMIGDYKKRSEFFRIDSKLIQISALEIAKESGINDISLYSPYEFALPYASNALLVPYTSTPYELFDYAIPFYQMVVNGIVDYSGMVINANDEKGMNYHLMHIFETGSNIAFTFSFENSNKLIQTDYNYYYYTEYSQWLTDVAEYLNIINGTGIHNAILAKHENVGNNTFKVTYQDKASYNAGKALNDSEKLVEIYLNYSDADVKIDELKEIIPSKSYIVKTIKGGK